MIKDNNIINNSTNIHLRINVIIWINNLKTKIDKNMILRSIIKLIDRNLIINHHINHSNNNNNNNIIKEIFSIMSKSIQIEDSNNNKVDQYHQIHLSKFLRIYLQNSTIIIDININNNSNNKTDLNNNSNMKFNIIVINRRINLDPIHLENKKHIHPIINHIHIDHPSISIQNLKILNIINQIMKIYKLNNHNFKLIKQIFNNNNNSIINSKMRIIIL